jgi:chromosome segregation ATPase
MAAKLQSALDSEGEARRREAKAIEDCRKQEELALKQKGQLADLNRQLESSGTERAAGSGSAAKAEETSEKQVREIAGLKNKLQMAEGKLDETERELRKVKDDRDKYHAQAEDLQRKIQNLNAASASTGDAASAASAQVKQLEAKINDLEARAKSFQMKASQAEEVRGLMLFFHSLLIFSLARRSRGGAASRRQEDR